MANTAHNASSLSNGPRDRRIRLAEAVRWAFAFVVTLSLAALAAVAGVALTVFGLGGVALALVASLALIGATTWRRAMLPISVIAVALGAGTAWTAGAPERLDRTFSTLRLHPISPERTGTVAVRRGVGDVLLDLRRYTAEPGSVSRFVARADAGHLVVALPTDRCFNLDVRYRTLDLRRGPSFISQAIEAGRRERVSNDASFSGLGLTTRASLADSRRAEATFGGDFSDPPPTTIYGFLGFNRWPAEPGRYQRLASGQPDAPTLRLDLASSQQMVLRSYPTDVDPLAVSPDDATGGMVWPEGRDAPAPPKQPSSLRTPENRSRWIQWERRLIRWTTQQARRAAGPCATRDELRARGLQFLTQPERLRTAGGDVQRLIAEPPSLRSKAPQRTVSLADSMLLVEVDGLGATRLLGVRPRAAISAGASR